MKAKKLKRVVIKEELVELTGDFKTALVLNQLIYWSERVRDTDNYIKEEKARLLKFGADNDTEGIELTNGWIYKNAEELGEELMFKASATSIRSYLKSLVNSGYIDERRNPKYKYDRTLQYRVNLLKIQENLHKMGYTLDGYTTAEFEVQTSDIELRVSEIVDTIPEITTEITTETKRGEKIPTKQQPIINTKTKTNITKTNQIINMRDMILAFTNDITIRAKLTDYFNIRIKRGMLPKQWEIILKDLREYAGTNKQVAISEIDNSIAGGYMQIIPQWLKEKSIKGLPPKFDNTKQQEFKLPISHRSDKEKEEFNKLLAKNDDGSFIEF